MKHMIPTNRNRLQYLLSTLLLLLLLPASACKGTDQIAETYDFRALGEEMRTQKLPLLLAFRADYCKYCRQLEDEYLKPMQQSGKYAERILIHRFTLDYSGDITDFNGKKLDANEFSARYKASITPTLVFVDADGKEIAEALVGYNSPDFYGAYLENAIDTAYKAMKTGDAAKNGGAP
jgi:thioredoxin-related protein